MGRDANWKEGWRKPGWEREYEYEKPNFSEFLLFEGSIEGRRQEEGGCEGYCKELSQGEPRREGEWFGEGWKEGNYEGGSLGGLSEHSGIQLFSAERSELQFFPIEQHYDIEC